MGSINVFFVMIKMTFLVFLRFKYQLDKKICLCIVH